MVGLGAAPGGTTPGPKYDPGVVGPTGRDGGVIDVGRGAREVVGAVATTVEVPKLTGAGTGAGREPPNDSVARRGDDEIGTRTIGAAGAGFGAGAGDGDAAGSRDTPSESAPISADRTCLKNARDRLSTSIPARHKRPTFRALPRPPLLQVFSWSRPAPSSVPEESQAQDSVPIGASLLRARHGD